MKLGHVFDPRNNALNALRLTLATGVILWHSWPLSGRAMPYLPAERLLSEVFVDGFFTISGFLITASWLRRPSLREYWAARVLRIFPGLWLCLLVTAFVIAPVGVAIQGGSAADLETSSAPVEYVLNNGVLNVYYASINGTPTGVPYPGVWNGSIWTLFFELLCYVIVSVLGVIGLLKRRWTIPILFVLAVCWSAYVSYPTLALQTWPQMLARFAVVFLAGALLHQFKNAIPARWSLVAVSIAVVIAAGLLQNYRIVAAIPLAYAIIVSGALIKNRRLNLRHDLSYGVYIYAFPIQQLLVICGLAGLNPVLFFILATMATLPLAALSWFLVEKRALSLKSRFKRKGIATAGEGQAEQAVSG
jgi:peptidoglycan/LPS O-acetylase OafA/YrhL